MAAAQKVADPDWYVTNHLCILCKFQTKLEKNNEERLQNILMQISVYIQNKAAYKYLPSSV